MDTPGLAFILQRLRRFISIAVLAMPALLGAQPSFAYLSAPLSSTYIIACAPQVPCAANASYYISTSPVSWTQNGTPHNSTLIGYFYQTQVSGTVPVYIAACIPASHCATGQTFVITNSPPTGVVGTLVGYANSPQVSGTVPFYIIACSARLSCGSGQTVLVSTSPVSYNQNGTLISSQLIGYAYSAPPSPVTFTLSPKYYISSVIYVPPGQGPSSVMYGSGTVTGTTLSTTQTWTQNASVGISFGLTDDVSLGITFGDNFSGQNSQSTDMQTTYNTSTTYRGPASNALNHDYDQILIFLGVKVNVSVDYLGNPTWAADFSQIASQGFAESGYPISVGCLRPGSTIDPSLCTAVVGFLNSNGIQSADYPNIIGADPFWNPAGSPSPDHNRFVLVDSVNFLPDPTISTVTYNVMNSTTVTNSSTVNYSYSVGANVSGTYDGVTLKVANTMTWMNSSTTSNKTGSTGTSSFTLTLPSSPYSGPSTLFVWMDTIYKTFMFSFTQ